MTVSHLTGFWVGGDVAEEEGRQDNPTQGFVCHSETETCCLAGDWTEAVTVVSERTLEDR